MSKTNETKVHFSFEYRDGTEWNFEGIFEGTENEILAQILMITRGTLMASSGNKGTAYNPEGFEICSYQK